MTTNTNPTPTFILVPMVLEPSTDGATVVLPEEYSVTVTSPNTIIAYQMVEPTPVALRFTDATINPGDGKGEFSTPSISPDGRLLTLIDLCSCDGTFEITFKTSDDKGSYLFDPQITNVPH